MKIVKIALAIVVLLAVALGATALIARNSDGPIGMFPGGPLVGGDEIDRFIVGWGWAREVDTIEMQLIGDDTSRTTWFVEHLARGYIPASTAFPPGKNWHERADGQEAWLRIEGDRYHVRLDRIDDAELMAELRKVVERKYGASTGGEVWWFKLHSLAPIPAVTF